MNHRVKHTPQKSHLLIFLLIITDDLWRGHAHLYAVNNKLSGFLQRLTGEALREKYGTTQFSQLEIWMNSACMSSHLPFKVLQLHKYFIITSVKVTERSPAQAEHTSTRKRHQRVNQNPSNAMAKIKTIDYFGSASFSVLPPWPLPSPCPLQHFVVPPSLDLLKVSTS